MAVNTAVILAAGMGSRLGAIGGSAPKGFLRLGADPIVVESIQQLRSYGIGRVVIVTGYRSEHYERLREEYGAGVETVHNPRYAESGSMYSLYCARACLHGDFLLLESDLIYEPRALEAAIDFPRDNAVLLSGPTVAGDEVYAEVDGARLTDLSKNRAALRNAAGELVGISKISRHLFQCMLRHADRAFETNLQVAYETDTLVAVARTQPVYYSLIPDLCWAEIDDLRHLVRAREQIYPLLTHKRRTAQPGARRAAGWARREEAHDGGAGDES
jgi:2-aminoethylphosphonate-pyruvate transaminase